MQAIDFVIRMATAEDATPLAELLERVFATTYGAVIPQATLAQYLARTFAPSLVAADIARAATTYLIATSGGAIIGASVLAGGPPEQHALTNAVELTRLYVDAPWHGCGVARALLHRTLAAACAQGYTTLWLCVWEHNERAQAFYRKHGLVPFGHTPVWVDHIRFDDILMQRTLHDY